MICIESCKFEKFLADFKKGKFGTQRLGQAFYNEWKLERVSDQSSLNNIWAKDGEHAIRAIHAMADWS